MSVARSVLLPACFLAVLLHAAVAAQPEQPCLQSVNDPADDQTLPSNPVVDTAPADVLRLAMEWTDAGVVLTVELSGDPREVQGFTYSYWVGFEDGGHSAEGNPPTWTWQGDPLYERIQTMYWASPGWYPVIWNGTTFSFTVPWEDFDAQYGENWTHDIGSPRVSTSGPNPQRAGTNNPSEDSAYYSFDLVPLRPCEDPTETGGSGAEAPSERTDAGAGKSMPGPSWLVAGLLVTAVAAGRRR